MQAALLAGKQSKACVMYYGAPEENLDKLKTLNAPVFFVWPEQDQWINKAMVSKFEANMKKANKSVSRVPLLADIPIVGELFKVRDQSFVEKEVAVIVTMKRVAPSESRAQVADQLLETSEDDVNFSFFD